MHEIEIGKLFIHNTICCLQNLNVITVHLGSVNTEQMIRAYETELDTENLCIWHRTLTDRFHHCHQTPTLQEEHILLNRQQHEKGI